MIRYCINNQLTIATGKPNDQQVQRAVNNWTSVETDLQGYLTAIQRLTVCNAITSHTIAKQPEKSDCTATQILTLDLDCKTKAQYAALIPNPLIQSASIVAHSLSYDGQSKHNFRAYYFLKKPIRSEDSETLIKQLYSYLGGRLYGCDSSTANINRIWFPIKEIKAQPLTIFDLDWFDQFTLNDRVDDAVQVIDISRETDQAIPGGSSFTGNSKTASESFMAVLARHHMDDADTIIQIINSFAQDNRNALVFPFPHRVASTGYKCEWTIRTQSPYFHSQATEKSDALCISRTEDNIRWTEDRSGNRGDILDLAATAKYGEFIKLVDNRKIRPTEIANELLKSAGLDEWIETPKNSNLTRFSASAVLAYALDNDRIKVSNKVDRKASVFIYDQDLKIWNECDDHADAACMLIGEYAKVKPYSIMNKNGDVGSTLDIGLTNGNTLQVKNFIAAKKSSISVFNPEYEKYVFCANAVYNKTTKLTEPYTQHHLCLGRSSYAITDTVDDEILNELRKHLTSLIDGRVGILKDTIADYLIAVIAAMVKNEGYKIGRMILLTGKPGSGKSSLLNLIRTLMTRLFDSANVISNRGYCLFDDRDIPLKANTIGVFIDEFTSKRFGNTALLRDCLGNKDVKTATINPKMKRTYTTNVYAAFIGACEFLPHFASDDSKGILRRILPIAISANKDSESVDRYEYFQAIGQWSHNQIETLYNSLLRVDTDNIYQQTEDLAKLGTVKQDIDQLDTESNPMEDFLADHYDVDLLIECWQSKDPKQFSYDRISKRVKYNDFSDAYLDYVEREYGYRPGGRVKATKALSKYITDHTDVTTRPSARDMHYGYRDSKDVVGLQAIELTQDELMNR